MFSYLSLLYLQGIIIFEVASGKEMFKRFCSGIKKEAEVYYVGTNYNTYVVVPRIRWQGMLENPLCSFWGQDLSEVWARTEIEKRTKI